MLHEEAPGASPVVQKAEVDSSRELSPDWGPGKRLLLRFLSVYLFLYIFPFPLSYLAGTIVRPYDRLWDAVVPWVGERIFGIAVTVRPNDSGDTTYNYVQVFCFLVLAAAAALVWTLLDRKWLHLARLDLWLRAYVHLWLAVTMISYGAYKVIPSQFPPPSLDRLLQPIGDASPMGMLWTFMGASMAYNVFTGLTEMLGGLLLVPRRTALAGALISAGALTNVVALNFCYDVPFKLSSSHLLLAALFLAAPHLRQVANSLVFHRRMQPVEIRPLFASRRLHWGALVLRTAFILLVTGMALHQSYQKRALYASRETRHLHGIWETDRFEVDGRLRPPLITDELRWRRVVFDAPGAVALQRMDERRELYLCRLDPVKRTLALAKRDDPAWTSTLSFQRTDRTLRLEGVIDGRRIRASLHRVEPPRFLLIHRGFHWINERPFNR